MSLGLVVKVPEGLVLAAESRVTVTVADKETGTPRGQAAYDNTTKLFSFNDPHDSIGVVTYGQAFIGNRTAYGYFTEFNEQLSEQHPERISVYDFAKELSQFFKAKWDATPPPPPPAGMIQEPISFLIAGYNENEVNGRKYAVVIPDSPEPVEQHEGDFGITYGGDGGQIVYRLINGYDANLRNTIENAGILGEEQKSFLLSEMPKLELPFLYSALPLQDAVDLAILLIRATINVQRLAMMPRTCGGPIDVCTITSVERLRYVQRKQITGEKQPAN